MLGRQIICLVAWALFLAVATAEATTIVVVRSAFNVYIGADSLRREGDARSEICKIKRHGDTVVAIAGFMAAQGSPVSIETALDEAGAAWSGTVEQRADTLANVTLTGEYARASPTSKVRATGPPTVTGFCRKPST